MFSFSRQKTAADVSRRMRRLCDLTVPGFEHELEGTRRDSRVNRCLPVVLAPWHRGAPAMGCCLMAVTKDLGDEGVSLVATHPLTAREVVLGFWVPDPVNEQPWFFLGELRHSTAMGGGFWAIGVKLTEYADTLHSEALAPLLPYAHKLYAPACPVPSS